MAASKARAEADLRVAIRTLQNVLPKETQSTINRISFPQFDGLKSVEENAADLEDAVEQLISIGQEQKTTVEGGHRIKEYVWKWYQATYPFTTLFLAVSKEASAVILRRSVALSNLDSLTKPVWSSLCRASGDNEGEKQILFVSLIGQVAYDESGRGEEVDEMMKDLSRPLRRIQLEEGFHGDLSSPALIAVQVAALNILIAVLEALTYDIHYLTDSRIGKPSL